MFLRSHVACGRSLLATQQINREKVRESARGSQPKAKRQSNFQENPISHFLPRLVWSIFAYVICSLYSYLLSSVVTVTYAHHWIVDSESHFQLLLLLLLASFSATSRPCRSIGNSSLLFFCATHSLHIIIYDAYWCECERLNAIRRCLYSSAPSIRRTCNEKKKCESNHMKRFDVNKLMLHNRRLVSVQLVEHFFFSSFFFNFRVLWAVDVVVVAAVVLGHRFLFRLRDLAHIAIATEFENETCGKLCTNMWSCWSRTAGETFFNQQSTWYARIYIRYMPHLHVPTIPVCGETN